jgi:hypothetical protein
LTTAAGAGAEAVGAEAAAVDFEAAVEGRVAGLDAVAGVVAARADDVTAVAAGNAIGAIGVNAAMRITQARQRHLGFGVISMDLSA